ncbi:MAG: metalloregulator ArsR/SmtB family transcription factor [Spirochaetes bacterium]|nr:metalloregulator ArsR/SmtB family transcription factor [Spirochaetota bacterium]
MEAQERFDPNRLNEVSVILKALSHPSRLLMVEALGEKPHCVCELTALVGSDTSTVSKHLSILKQAGIVVDEKRGNMVFYNLRCRCVLDALHDLIPLLEEKHKHYSRIVENLS